MQIKPVAAFPAANPVQNLNTPRAFSKPLPVRPMTKPMPMTTLSELPHRAYKPAERPGAAKDPSALSFTGPAAAPAALPNALQTEGIGAPQPPASPPAQLTLDGLIGAWGTADTNYDFNGDGVVGVPDLLQMIENLKKFASESMPSNTINDSANSALTEAIVNEGGDMPAEELAPVADKPAIATTPDATDASGEMAEPPATDVEPAPIPSASPSTDVHTPSDDAALDLRAYVNSMASGDSRRTAGLNGAAARAIFASDSVGSRGATHSMGGLKPMADSLFNHLSSSGFAEQPPTNIRELVDALNLAPRQTDFLLKQLAMKYPAGLGVNMVG